MGFVKKDKRLALDAVFLDEAQDLSPLQWDMFFHIEEQCKRSYIAGDDDQTIYGFQGADPSIFINLRGEIGEFNIAQVTMGRSTRPILDVINIPHVTLDNDINLHKKVSNVSKHLNFIIPIK